MTRAALVAFPLLLAAAIARAQEPEIRRTGPPPVEDFETDADNDGVPDGWYNLRDAKIVETGGPHGPKTLRFDNTKVGRQARASRAFGVDGRKTEALIVGIWIKGSNLRTGERLGEDASLQIDFLGEQLTSTGRAFVGPWTNRTVPGGGWVRVARRLPVPSGTRDAILSVGLLGAIGTLEVDGLTIEEVPVGGRETTNLLLNGDFELGDPRPPFWTLEEGARRVFPGNGSATSLEISGAGSRALSGLGVRTDRFAELEISLVAKGTNLSRSAGATAKLFFRDADGKALAPPDDGANLFRWSGQFDWKAERIAVRVPTAATRAVLQIETLGVSGSLQIDDVVVRVVPDPQIGKWKPYHIEEDSEGWRPLEPAATIAKGSALDASTLLEAPAGKHGAVTVKNGRLHFADGTRARFFGAVVLPPVAFSDREAADALAERLARSGVNLVRFDALDSPYGPAQSLYDDSRDDTLALDPDALVKFDHFIAALKARGIYIALELLAVRRFREGDGVPGWLGLPPGGGQAAAFDPKIRDLAAQAADLLLGHVNSETKIALRNDPVLAWVTLAGELSLLDRIDEDESLPPESESILKDLLAKAGAGRSGWASVESSQWKAEAESLRKLGLKRPIAGSSHWRRESEFNNAQARPWLDLIDDRLYWAPPRFGSPEHRSMLWKASATLSTEADRKRRKDRPYVVGEWCAHTDGAWALPFEGADLMLASRIASLEDWDAITRRGIALHPKVWGSAPAGTTGSGDTFAAPEVANANPQIFALLPHASSVFLRPRADTGPVKRTSQSSWDATHGRLVIDTPFTQGIAGWFARRATKLEAIAVETETPYTAVMASSLGPETLPQTKRILVTAVARAAPTDILYADRWRREIGSPGRGPILVEPVRAKVTIRRKGNWKAFALQPDGSRGAQVPLKSVADGLMLEIAPDSAILHWEVVGP